MKKRANLKRILLHKGINTCTFFAMLLFLSVFIIGNVYAYQFKFSEFDWDTFYADKKGFWDDACKNSTDEDCDEEIIKTQKQFYTKLYKSLAVYEKDGVLIPGTKEYEYADDIILETVFYEMTPSQFSDTGEEYVDTYEPNSNKGLYSIDQEDLENPEIKIDYNDPDVLTYFEKETDTIKTLVQNLIANTTDCYGIYGPPTYITTENGEKYAKCDIGSVMNLPTRGEKCAVHIQNNELGFWKYYISKIQHDETLPWYTRGAVVLFLGRNTIDENYETCKSYKSSYPEGTTYIFNDNPKLSTDRFFDFLSYNKYFDGKPHLQRKFKETILDPAKVDCMTSDVCDNSLEALGEDKYDYYEGEAIEVRRLIIEDIISILENYGFDVFYDPILGNSYNAAEVATATRKSFFWPIGSDETEERNGVIYADGEPASTDIVSPFGTRENPITGAVEEHYGIDIAGVEGSTNVIAVYRGEVVGVVNSCSVGDYECNEGYGNMVIIAHPNNDYTVYAHLASIEPSITMGSSVDKGQLLGTVGATGATKEAVLHYELRKGGNDVLHAVNPVESTDPSNPRPKVAEGDFSVHETSLTREEFASLLRAYCVSNKCSSTFMNVFVANAEQVYDDSIANNVNPELVVIRGAKEGMSPGGNTHNYWGIGCANGAGVGACYRYSSLSDGIRGFANVVAKYDTVSEMMSKYAYIGAVWYNPGSWSLGGCKYYPYINEYMSPGRSSEVSYICNNGPSCGNKSDPGCSPTTDEDQMAYAMYNASGMVNMRYVAFGL